MDNPQEHFLERPEFEAVVVSVDDPDKLLRVQVMVMGLFDGVPDDKLPWATYKLPVGARVGEGDFTPVQKGDLVWIDFPYYTHGRKDTRRPRITGSVHHAPNGKPNLPNQANGDPYPHKRSHKEPKPIESDYHEPKVYILHGMLIEVEKGSVYRITHMESGTALELSNHAVLHVEGDSHHSAIGDIEIHCNGNNNQSIGAKWNIKVTGTANIDAAIINLNKGVGVVTGAHLCAFTGKAHSDFSKTVNAGK